MRFFQASERYPGGYILVPRGRFSDLVIGVIDVDRGTNYVMRHDEVSDPGRRAVQAVDPGFARRFAPDTPRPHMSFEEFLRESAKLIAHRSERRE